MYYNWHSPWTKLSLFSGRHPPAPSPPITPSSQNVEQTFREKKEGAVVVE